MYERIQKLNNFEYKQKQRDQTQVMRNPKNDENRQAAAKNC